MSEQRVKETEDRKAAEQSLRLMKFAVDHASDSLFWIRPDAGFAYVNDSTCSRLGYTRDELLAMTVFDVDPAFPREAWAVHWQEIKERKSFTIETTHRTKTGEVFPVEVSVNYVEYEGAEYNFAFARDMSERTKAEDALRKANEQLEITVASRTTELKNRQRQLDLIVDASPMIIFYKDSDGKFVRVNTAFSEMLNVPKEDFEGKTVFDLYSPQIAQNMASDDREVLQSGRPKMNIIEQYESTSGIRWVRTDKIPICRENGMTEGLVGFAQDITERKLAEEALRRSEQKYRQLFSEMLGAFALHEIICNSSGKPVDYVTLEINRAFETSLDVKGEQVIGKKVSEFLSKAELDHWLGIFGPVALTGESARYEMHSPSNQKVFEGVVFSPEKGKFAVTFFDVTSRKQAEQERQANLKFFESMDKVNRAIQGTTDLEQMMSDVLGVALAVFDADRAYIVYPVDPEAATYRVPMERTTPEYPGALDKGMEVPIDAESIKVFRAVLGSDSPVTFGPGCDAALPSHLTNYFGVQSQAAMAIYPRVDKPYMFGVHQCSYPRIWTTEEKKLLKEIGRRLADALTSLLAYQEVRTLNEELEQRIGERTADSQKKSRELQENQVALMNIVEDLNEKTAELESANVRLHELDQLKSMFIASMSHELRTPLNSIIGFSSIMLNEWTGPVTAEQKENLAAVLRSGKHLLSLINDVIDVSKIEAGKIESIAEEFDARELVLEAVETLKKDIENKGLELHVQAPQQVMYTDRRRLLQCLLNLVSNAVKYTPKGSIRVSTDLSTDGSMMILSVEDTGIGIREDELCKLFLPFVRLTPPSGAIVPGTGLGLYLTNKLVREILGGDILVSSTYGTGSRFTLRVPVAVGNHSAGR